MDVNSLPEGRKTSGDIFSKTVPLTLECHGFGERRKASLSAISVNTIENEADEARIKAMLGLSKRLLNSAETRAIRQRDREHSRYLRSIATPFRPGFFLVPLGMVETAEAESRKWERERAALVDLAVAAYPGHVTAMATELGPLYTASDYPSPEAFKAKWWTDWQFINFGVPGVLKAIKMEIFDRERAKVERKGAEAAAAIEQHLVVSLKDITDHLVTLLTPKADGTMPRLRGKALDNLTAYLDTIALRDVTGFAALTRETDVLKRMTQGLTVDRLRDDESTRAAFAADLATVTRSLDKLVDADERGFVFDADAYDSHAA